MYHIILDSPSPYLVNIPTPNQPTKLITAGQNFVAYDETLPPEEQSYLLPVLRQHLQECVPSQNSFKSSEAKRTIASEAVKRLDEQAKVIIRKIHRKIDLEYMETPEAAEEWGFQVKQSTRNILMPRTRPQRLALLNAYIAKEESQPEKERFRVPKLAQAIELRDMLTANTLAYQTGQTQKENSFEAIKALTFELCECLQGAGIHLLGVDYYFKPTTQLQNWGYDVTLKRKSSTAKDTDEEAAPDSPADTTTTNGAADAAVDSDGPSR